MSEFDPQFARDIQTAAETVKKVLDRVAETVVGQEQLERKLLMALLVDGHVLIEGVPGLGKTLSVRVLAAAIEAQFRRIQFTPDLLPADITGSEVYRPQEGAFLIRQGPVFTNFLLADEINRAPAKVQSALLETMQERQVTIGDKTLSLPSPFLVLATQNPVEQEGTYALPEAQVDRFIMKLKVDYPSRSEEKQILDLIEKQEGKGFATGPVITLAELDQVKKLSQKIYVDDRVKRYIVDIVAATRKPSEVGFKGEHFIELGASPRATISMFLLARAEALLSGERFVVPQNVKDIAFDVLRHRVKLSYEAEAEGLTADTFIQEVLTRVAVP